MASPGKENSAAPLLALKLGGPVLMAIVSAVAFATILAVVAGLAITAATSFAHDIYASVIKKGQVSPNGEVRIARITVVVVGILAIIGGIAAQGQNVAFLVALAFAIAAAANLPTIIYSLYWRKFTTRGALWSMYGGLIISLVLIIFSPVVSGKIDKVTGKSLSMIQDTHIDFHWFPLENPGIVAIPIAFILGWLFSVLPSRARKENKWIGAEMEVRSLTGFGAEKATQH
jgi:cation/acetate symporter